MGQKTVVGIHVSTANLQSRNTLGKTDTISKSNDGSPAYGISNIATIVKYRLKRS